MSALNIEIDTKAFRRWEKLYPKQVAFVSMKAINKIALDIQKATIANLEKKFVIRRKAFAKRSIKVTHFAKKPALYADIEVISKGAHPETFSKFEEGVNAYRAKRSRRIAVPVPGFHPNKQKVIPKSKRPRNLKNSFQITTKAGHDLILQSKGKKRRRKSTIAYSLEKQVRIPKVLGFYRTANGIMSRKWTKTFAAEFRSAILTAR